MEKPMLGVVFTAKENHFHGEIDAMRASWEKRFAGDDTIQYVGTAVLFDEEEITAAAHALKGQGADLIVFVVGTWIYSSHIISAANDLGLPFVLYGLSDDIANGNLGASVQIRYVLEEMGHRFLYLAGAAIDEAAIQVLLCRLRAAAVIASLRNRKIATIGGKCMMMYQTQVNEFSWKRIFGVDFPHYDTLQIFKEMQDVTDEQASVVEREFMSKIKRTVSAKDGDEIASDAVHSQAKMYLAFRRLQNLYGIEAFANKCMPEMCSTPYGYGYAACLATCMLNEAGIVTACEADVPAALSMLILRKLCGQPPFFADIGRLNKRSGGITFFNCGTAPYSLADPATGPELWPIPGNIGDEAVPKEYRTGKTRGATVKFELRKGEIVTLLRIGGNGDTLRMHCVRAKTCAREVNPGEVFGERWPGFGIELETSREEFLQKAVGHHYSLVYGDFSRELEAMADIYNISFVRS